MGMLNSFCDMKKVRDESSQLNEIPCSAEAISLIMALTVDVLRTCGVMVKMGELESKMSVSKLAPPSAVSQQGNESENNADNSSETDPTARETEMVMMRNHLNALVSHLENGLVVLYSKLPRAAVDALMTLQPAEIPGLPAEKIPTNSLPYSFVSPRHRKMRPMPSSPYEMPQMATMMPGRGYFGQGMFGENPFDKTPPRNDGYSQAAMPPPRAPHPRRANANPDRELTPPEHGWNAKYNSGVTGVVWDRVHQAWVVSWTLGGKRTFRHFTCKSYGGFDLARESAIEFRLARNKEIDAYNRRARGRG